MDSAAATVNALRISTRHFKKITADGTSCELQCSGKKGSAYFGFTGLDVERQYAFGDKPEFETISEVMDELTERFIAGEFTSVRVAYMRYESNARQIPEIMQLLPMKIDQAIELMIRTRAPPVTSSALPPKPFSRNFCLAR